MHGSGVPVQVNTFGGLVTLANPDNLPAGASPRTYDTDFNVGNVKTRAGLVSMYRQADAEVGPNGPASASGVGWLNPTNITANDGSFTSTSPVNGFNFIDLGTFAFSIPSTTLITGVLVDVRGFSDAPTNLVAQLIINGSPTGEVKTLSLPQSEGSVIFGSLTDQWSMFLTAANMNAVSFGVRLYAQSVGFDSATAFLDYAAITIGVNTGTSNFQFITTFNAQNGDVKNLLLDANGNFWVEDVTNNPGVIDLVRNDITPGSYAVGVNGPDVEYLAFSNGFTGSDMPLQYTPNWMDRITQVGPGAAPTFTPIAAPGTNYPIVQITQPGPHNWNFSYFLQSAGPGSNTPGNVITFYYADSTLTGADTDLVDAVNSGFPVYVYASFTGTPTTFGPEVVQVTSVGLGQPPGQPRAFYYFTFNVNSIAYTYYAGSGHPGYTANYQRTLATLVTSVPVPNLTIGKQINVSGVTPSDWNATWTISQTPDSSTMAITGSSVTGGTATYNYAVTGASANPQVGELVTITNTLNAGGQLNVTQYPIATVVGGSTGSFTVDGFPGTLTAGFQSESGFATTAGTIFEFDPGAALVGTATNPIFGTGTGGNIVFNPTGLAIDPGTYQGTVFFITRNGYYTAPAAPVTFTIPENTQNLQVTNLPIGPPNIVARGIAITEAGQNGVPGANFFTLPTPVDFYLLNTKYTTTSFFVQDNTSASVTLFFTQTVLLNGLAIDVYGYNLFNQIEIGDPGWVSNYADRNFYGLCINKVQNFTNLSFDGGYLSGQTAPLGWTQPDQYGSLVASPKFGNSYYIKNTSGAPLDIAGSVWQSAYQDSTRVPILNSNTKYSARVTVSNPSNIKGGYFEVRLVSAGVVVGSYIVQTTAMSTDLNIYTGSLLSNAFATVPSDLLIQVQSVGLAPGGDILIDRVDIFPTEIPILTTTVYGSYAGLPEQVDAITGAVKFTSENQQPVNGAVVMYDTLYAMKGTLNGASLYSLQASSNLEPAQWQEPEVAQKSGAIGIMAFDFGEQWIVMANRNGVYLFEGGQPGKIMQEIYQVWDAVNWSAASTIWMRNDVINRKLYVGVPMPTPNYWLPNAPVNTNPSSPNVMLVCNYKGLDSGAELRGGRPMTASMFGNLDVIDMRRKWSISQIPSPYANIVQTSGDVALAICNGRGNSKVYSFDEAVATDDGIVIDSLYTTSGLPDDAKRGDAPALGPNRVRWGYLTANLQSGGTVNTTLYTNQLPVTTGAVSNPNAWTVPGGFTPGNPAMNDIESSLNFVGTRTFAEFRQNDGNLGFNLSTLTMYARKDTWNTFRGAK